MQKIIIIGNITKDLTIQKTATGKDILKFSVATNEKIKDKQITEFWNCEAWEKTAEIIAKYFTKGSRIALELEKRTSKYEKDGKELNYTSFIVRGFDFCGKTKTEETENTQIENTQAKETENQFKEIMADDIDEEINIEDLPF